jgi:hypothetical protein
MPATNKNPVPFSQEVSGTFWTATWNIVNGRGGRSKEAAKGLAQLGIGVGVLTETKIVNN